MRMNYEISASDINNMTEDLLETEVSPESG
jgi:hypothetical protein